MSSARGESHVSERGKRRTSRDNSPYRNTSLEKIVSPEHKLHVPNYMKPTISSSLGQSRRTISSSSKETLIRSSFKKSSTSPCPRVNRSSSFNHEPSRPLVPSSPRKSKNQLLEPLKSHFSKGHNRIGSSQSLDCKLNDKGKRVPALSRINSCIASPYGDDMSQTMNIEDHQLESSAQSHVIEGHCDPVLEDNARVMVVDQVNHNDYDPDKVFDEVQAMMLEDYNCHKEIHPKIVEEDTHDQPCTDVDITKSTNEIHPPHDVIENSYEIHHQHIDIENSNEIDFPVIEEDNVLIEHVHLTVIDDDKVLIDEVQLDNHGQDEDCRGQMIEDVHDKEDIMIVQANGCNENSREITNVNLHDQPYHCEKQVHRVVIEAENEKDVHDCYMKQEEVAFGDHFISCSTNLDIYEENKVSSSDEFNAKHQNQEQDHLNVTEAQEHETNQGDQGMTSTDVTKEAIEIEVEKESTTTNEQVKEPTIVTQVTQQQNETMTMNEQVKEVTIVTQASQEQNENMKMNEQVKEPTIVTQATQEQNETKKASINKRFIINKKEPTIAYNDVIEETRSKLVQDRKNKVKALVGAFETVMSIDKR